ncbi:unnamed protein product [Pseudo-nitzschia multistriata]|uniref:Uncharacterized protein n=1 Tax=Pseudo-nitzschia multistriata TaxID=183589 RepID=A0A448Z7A4_9STRA|nr:unnamed protein product [Pseudo-nitzschia multistriata]
MVGPKDSKISSPLPYARLERVRRAVAWIDRSLGNFFIAARTWLRAPSRYTKIGLAGTLLAMIASTSSALQRNLEFSVCSPMDLRMTLTEGMILGMASGFLLITRRMAAHAAL